MVLGHVMELLFELWVGRVVSKILRLGRGVVKGVPWESEAIERHSANV